MNRRYFFTAVGVLCALWAGCNVALGQWPGENSSAKSRTDAEGWPTFDRVPNGNSAPSNAEKFICTFDYHNATEALSHLQMGPHGMPLCPAGPSNYGSYFSGDQREALETLIQSAGVRGDRIIAREKAGMQNAYAQLCEDSDGEIKQLVAWGPEFLADLDRKTGTKWASVAVLAHELGHHLNNDTGQNPGRIPPHERREQELYADQFAGQKLRGLGASKKEAVAVFYEMGEGGDTHPHYSTRVDAAGEGWEKGVDPIGMPDQGPPPSGRRQRRPSPSPMPPPQPQPMAMACQTQVGVCPMMSPLSPGSYCICFTPYGQIPGIAR